MQKPRIFEKRFHNNLKKFREMSLKIKIDRN